ncbi:MAG TPA: metal-sulfur cluster assembly factor, partial [Miltoncostaeales bacterium]|nr:metal-sulfur cluster assembly factor [Miltoncostaeales bacterium]
MASDGEIRDAMMQVEDPELGINVVDLGLLYGVSQDDAGNVTLEMTLTSMGCPLTEKIIEDSRAALEPLEGVNGVDINWVWD